MVDLGLGRRGGGCRLVSTGLGVGRDHRRAGGRGLHDRNILRVAHRMRSRGGMVGRDSRAGRSGPVSRVEDLHGRGIHHHGGVMEGSWGRCLAGCGQTLALLRMVEMRLQKVGRRSDHCSRGPLEEHGPDIHPMNSQALLMLGDRTRLLFRSHRFRMGSACCARPNMSHHNLLHVCHTREVRSDERRLRNFGQIQRVLDVVETGSGHANCWRCKHPHDGEGSGNEPCSHPCHVEESSDDVAG